MARNHLFGLAVTLVVLMALLILVLPGGALAQGDNSNAGPNVPAGQSMNGSVVANGWNHDQMHAAMHGQNSAVHAAHHNTMMAGGHMQGGHMGDPMQMGGMMAGGMMGMDADHQAHMAEMGECPLASMPGAECPYHAETGDIDQ